MAKFLGLIAFFLAAASTYEVAGHVFPETRAAVSLHGATTPFTTSTQADDTGRFTFKKLDPGTYTLAIFVPSRGEARQTIEIGPSSADSSGRVNLTIHLKDADFAAEELSRRHAVSTRQLTVPDKALRAYEEAQKDLERRDTAAAIKHLEQAVELAPQFSAAWNNLGTIAYQTRQWRRAEDCFRQSLRQDPASFEPLVNLGGVLVTLHKLDEAMDYNVRAVLTRPNDALANGQLGMVYFELGQFDQAVKYLERARQTDPAHFSHPQLFLAEIHLRRGEKREAAEVMEDFLSHHPDYPQAAKVRQNIEEWRK
ncbi:MAG TPA: tetratricopeptide repeat protein [Candidatus Acidoferrales bacterium]|nr:tetratricopeptide repeat protein [Candidatus Acidoferrales bacterium]